MLIDFDFSLLCPFFAVRNVPFPLFQAQSRFVAHVWAGQIELPDENERLVSVKKQEEGVLREEDLHSFSGNLTVSNMSSALIVI